LALARSLEQFLGRRDLARQFIQFRDLLPRQRLPALGWRRTLAESEEKPPRFFQAESARFGVLDHSEPLQDRRIVYPPPANAARLRQHTGLLIEADRRRRQPGLFRHLPDRHS